MQIDGRRRLRSSSTSAVVVPSTRLRTGAVLRGPGGRAAAPYEKCAPSARPRPPFWPSPLDFHLRRQIISLIQLHIECNYGST